MLDILFANVAPLYLIIVFGFWMGRAFQADTKTLAYILIYGLVPVVMFGATANMELNTNFLYPPLMIGSISVCGSVLIYWGSKLLWTKDTRSNSLAMMSVSCNATYFGLPVGLALGGADWFGVYMIMVLPLFIIDALLCPYYCARGHYDVRESIIRVLKLPIIYGALGGLIFNLMGGTLTPLADQYVGWFTGAVVVIGMMIIGVALGRIKHFQFDWGMFSGIAISRYLIWPFLALIYIYLDTHIWQVFDPVIHKFLLLIAACPVAANNVAYAAKFDLNVELTAAMVAITTLIALFFIPGVFWLTGV